VTTLHKEFYLQLYSLRDGVCVWANVVIGVCIIDASASVLWDRATGMNITLTFHSKLSSLPNAHTTCAHHLPLK